MRLLEIISVRRLAAAGVLAGAIWCAPAHAQVLDQVPADALAVFKVKDLEKTSGKIAKLAKDFGLDELSPEMKDPLGSLLDKAKMTKGIDKSGDGALVIYAPDEKAGGDPEPIALIPVSDYDAFVGNFEKADKNDGGEGLTAVKDPDDGKTLYVGHRGKYAILSDKKDHLKSKGGIHLSALAAKEADAKDAVFFFNMDVVREKALPQIKDHRKEMMAEMDKTLAGEETIKPFAPVIETIVNKMVDTAQDFLTDADSVVFSLNISDTGINSAALVDFKPDSKLAKTVAALKAGNSPLLAGLPEGKYFLIAGGSFDSKAIGGIAAEWLDPVIKGLKDTNTDSGKKIASGVDAFKTVMSSSNHSAVGLVMPTKPVGQDSLIQEVSVIYGDARAITSGEKKMLTDMSDLMALLPENKAAKTSIVIGDQKTVDGVELTTYTNKFEFDKTDPQGLAVDQYMKMIYGPNGNSGAFGAVNDKTFIMTQGVDDELLKEVISSAKAEKDVLSDSAYIKSVSSQLPANPSAVYYIALDNIVKTALRYAQGFGLPIKVKLPDNLPPIGIAIATEEGSVRVESVIPTETVKAFISAGLQTYSDMQQGGKGGGL
ncbi:MAG TPA: hypothetical protein VFE47_09425 [Tepidisphaeraceae bacterium]|jgi:hypothetical protein|nr:hypothetical protein [Tepidisphaeraceae bacterium]